MALFTHDLWASCPYCGFNHRVFVRSSVTSLPGPLPGTLGPTEPSAHWNCQGEGLLRLRLKLSGAPLVFITLFLAQSPQLSWKLPLPAVGVYSCAHGPPSHQCLRHSLLSPQDSLLNDLFAPGPFKSVILPAAKGMLLNFKSDHVILLHKTLEGSHV